MPELEITDGFDESHIMPLPYLPFSTNPRQPLRLYLLKSHPNQSVPLAPYLCPIGVTSIILNLFADVSTNSIFICFGFIGVKLPTLERISVISQETTSFKSPVIRIFYFIGINTSPDNS